MKNVTLPSNAGNKKKSLKKSPQQGIVEKYKNKYKKTKETRQFPRAVETA